MISQHFSQATCCLVMSLNRKFITIDWPVCFHKYYEFSESMNKLTLSEPAKTSNPSGMEEKNSIVTWIYADLFKPFTVKCLNLCYFIFREMPSELMWFVWMLESEVSLIQFYLSLV